VTVVDSLHHDYVGCFSLSEIYFMYKMYMVFWELTLLPSFCGWLSLQ